MGSLKKKLRPPGKSKVQKLMGKSPVLKKLSGLPGAPPMPGMGGKGGKKMAAPMDPRQQAMLAAEQQAAGGPAPVSMGQAVPVAAGTPIGLPPGIDPNAVAADPQGYAQNVQGAAQQAAMLQSSPEMQQQLGTLGGYGGDLGAGASGNQAPAVAGQAQTMQAPGLAPPPPGAGQARASVAALRKGFGLAPPEAAV